MPKKNGRPTIFTEKLAEAICIRIADGESLRSICEDKKMPGLTTVRRWLADADREKFRLQYAQARDEQADFYADEIIEIADTSDGDFNKARLRIDARKWKAARMAPKKYGDKITQEVHGVNGGPIETRINFKDIPTDVLRDLRGIATRIIGGDPEPTSD